MLHSPVLYDCAAVDSKIYVQNLAWNDQIFIEHRAEKGQYSVYYYDGSFPLPHMKIIQAAQMSVTRRVLEHQET